MTSVADKGHPFVLGARVAPSAGDLLMLSDQGILGLRVVEFRARPTLIAMTVGALLSELAVVPVLLFMAAIAITRRFAVLQGFGCFGFVTALTCSRSVGTFQWIVARVVIEPRRVEPHDVVVAALVFSVAASAGKSRSALISSVKALASSSVGIDFLVAVHAKVDLSFLVERSVTLAAFVLFFRVSARNGPRHHEPLDVDCRDFAREDELQQRSSERGVSWILDRYGVHQ